MVTIQERENWELLRRDSSNVYSLLHRILSNYIVRIKRIVNNEIFTSGLDVFDNTPLLDIKPYVKDLDSKNDANYGWIDDLDSNKEHLLLHIKGIPHEY